MKKLISSWIFKLMGVLLAALGVYVYNSGYPNLLYVLALITVFVAAIGILLQITNRHSSNVPTLKSGLKPLIKGALTVLAVLAVLFVAVLIYGTRGI